jgi:O-methyltransferase
MLESLRKRLRDTGPAAPAPGPTKGKGKGGKGKKGQGMPGIDPECQAVIRRVRPRTMTSRVKLHTLVLTTRHLVRHGIEGDVVECGVWRGGSMQAIALTLMEQGDTSRDLHLFDTFQGMSEPTEHDFRVKDGRTADELMETRETTAKIWAMSSLEDVQEGMGELDYPAERIHYHIGKVEETLPSEAPDRIALLRLDTDWYESTRHELVHLYDRLVPGGILMIDDYGYWDGSRRATDEWLEETGHPLLLIPMGSGRIAVKP